MGYFPRWFYNTFKGKCQQFIFGGCRSNANNFHSKSVCEETCSGKFKKKGGMVICSCNMEIKNLLSMTSNFSANSTNFWDEKTVPYDSQLTQKRILLQRAFLPLDFPASCISSELRYNFEHNINSNNNTKTGKYVEHFLLFTYRFDFDSTHLLLVIAYNWPRAKCYRKCSVLYFYIGVLNQG